MKSKILTILLYILLTVIWCGVLFASVVFILSNTVIERFGNGILKAVFVLVYLCAVILPIILRKKIKTNYIMPSVLIVSTIAAIIINGAIYSTADNYMSTYSRQKWDNNEELRFYMIDDLERQYDFIGKDEQEIIDLLGSPSNISEHSGKRFEYYIGDDYIDPYTYDIIFKDGIVIRTGIVQH